MSERIFQNLSEDIGRIVREGPRRSERNTYPGKKGEESKLAKGRDRPSDDEITRKKEKQPRLVSERENIKARGWKKPLCVSQVSVINELSDGNEGVWAEGGEPEDRRPTTPMPPEVTGGPPLRQTTKSALRMDRVFLSLRFFQPSHAIAFFLPVACFLITRAENRVHVSTVNVLIN